MKAFFAWALSAWLVSSAVASSPYDGSVELHAHLFMKEGMGWAFNGDFFGPLRAKDWTQRFSSQANPEALARSGAAVVVASLYAHPLFTTSLKDSIRRQLSLARRFVSLHPDWIIAADPGMALNALHSGKHVLILALEGASGILEDERDLQEFIDADGIRIVGPLHLTDDEYGGVAFLRGWRALSNPLEWLRDLFLPEHADGVKINSKGLTEKGRWLVRSLVARGVWIDLAHASDHSMDEIMRMLEEARQPLLYTHTTLRKYLPAERGISESELERVARSGGIIGLMPSEEMLYTGPRSSDCPSGVYLLTQEYREVAAKLGAESVMMGSDYNGGLPHLKPGCRTGTSLDREGLWNMGQIGDLWKAMKVLGAPIPEPLSKTSERFVSAWSRVKAQPSSTR